MSIALAARTSSLVATSVLLAGCVVTAGTGTGGGTGSGTGGASPDGPDDPAGSAAPTSRVELLGTPQDLSVTLPATIASLRQFWSEALPAVYDRPFEDLAGGFQAKDESSPAWTCGGQQVSYADVQGNAFYCGGPDDDYIAYDVAALFPQLNERFGGATPSVVLAHEMGHAVQARIGLDAPSVVQELQADCFAGAWAAFAQESDRDPVEVDPSALDGSVRAVPTLRDQPGTPATAPGAHGLGFDRVNAYQTGYEEGAARCARFPEQGGVTITELPFRTPEEAQTGGNLPYPDTVSFAVEALDEFWAAALPALASGTSWRPPRPAPGPGPLPDCPGEKDHDPTAVAAYCTPTDTVAWSDPLLTRVHEVLGDVGAASVLALSWSRAAQVRADLRSSGSAAEVQQSCLTGAWLSTLPTDPRAPVSLSPGDIDEGLLAVLTPLDSTGDEQVISSSFERAEAYRTGLLGGLGAC